MENIEKNSPEGNKEIIQKLFNDAKNQEINQAKIEYDRMTSLYEKLGTQLIWGITVLFTVIAIISYSSFKDMNEDVEKKIEKMVKETKDAEDNSAQDLKDVEVKANVILNQTQKTSEMRIGILEKELVELAKISAKNRVDEKLASPYLDALIDKTTRKEVADKLNEVVKEEIDKTREVFEILPKLTIAYERTSYYQGGDRKSLDFIEECSRFNEFSVVKESATQMLKQRGKEYDSLFLIVQRNLVSRENILHYGDDTRDTSKATLLEKLNLPNLSSDREIIRQITLRLRNEVRLSTLTMYYIYLRKLTGKNFNTFDSQPVYNWYNTHYKK